MLHYYQGNALYDYIITNKVERYNFVTGNMWQLVYGDHCSTPKLLIVVSGVDEKDWGDFSDREIKAFRQLNQLSNLHQLPCFLLQFKAFGDTFDEINLCKSSHQLSFTKLTPRQLKDLFRDHGLAVNDKRATKYLNDKVSSAYHKWQRDTLGSDITVSDIDLWIHKDNKLFAVCELKRSKVSLEKWEPYEDDFKNFRLIHNLSYPNYKFFIIYNLRTPSPFKDDISLLKVFEVDFSQSQPIRYVDTYPVERLISR
ncbi:hypothetical protein JMN32_00255 [Fulvivirga sp. 29W222]|uniref:Uncharacterized protein n=1 Tax=Fulvivirga marina TaxID=2494733 RepID=A0A937FSX0_9BACT|nr:hypothetical protein [Fulvivirga marina]MBL6444719.1 hypothetical protein [Fulvivirga marina]